MTRPQLQPLEDRRLLSAGGLAHITSVFADNRGQVTLGVDGALNSKTLNNKSVHLFTAGSDGQFNTDDDVAVDSSVSYSKKSKTITVTSDLAADTRYRVVLNGSRIKGTNGKALDGELKSHGKSGNGKAGGDFDVVTSVSTEARPTARFTTQDGIMDLTLYRDQVQTTVDNFIYYANKGYYDRTFLHREITKSHRNKDVPQAAGGIDIIQGGGFAIGDGDTLSEISDSRAPIPLEAGISNTKGTISMARMSDIFGTATATSEWFFNFTDNVALDANPAQGSNGYAVFGKVTNKASLKVLKKLSSHTIADASTDSSIDENVAPALSTVPVKDVKAFNKRMKNGKANLKPSADLIKFSRVAIQMDISAT